MPKLEAAARAKNAFLALLGHELRNPLAPIRHAVQLMRHAGPGSEAAQRATSVIDRQSAHLARLVDDLLDVTRIDHGKIELRKEVVNLRGLVQSAVQDHRGALEQAGVQLTLDVPSAAVLTHGDRIRFAQIVGNILHNATKFTPRGGRIVMRFGARPDGHRGGKRQRRRHLARTTWRESSSCSRRRIPAVCAETPAWASGWHWRASWWNCAAARKGCKRRAGPGQHASPMGAPAVVVAPSKGAVAETTAPATDDDAARVLVVDDNQDSADTLSEMLSMTGFSSTVAYDGQAALHAVEHEVPDAVLLDIGLPDMSGYEVCQRIRHSNMTRQPVLIALTGWGKDKDRALAMTAGFCSFD